jgi:Helix-turn-helix domain
MATLTETLVDADEAARLLSVTARTLGQWRYKGIGPPYLKIGSKIVRYRLSDLVGFIQASVRQTVAAPTL